MNIKSAILLDEIGKIPLFQGVAQHELESLLKVARRKHLQAGEFFFLQNDPVEYMKVLLDWRVQAQES